MFFQMTTLTASRRQDIIETGRRLWELAEPGFRERKTHDYLAGRFSELGMDVRPFDGIPGFLAGRPEALDGSGERIALIADMDALPNPGSTAVSATAETGSGMPGGSGGPSGAYIHSCGHHMQMTNLYGSAAILSDSNSPVLKQVVFIAAPAEEYIDFEIREPLRESGVIGRLSGKQELLDRGVFSNISMVVSTHGAGFDRERYISSVRRMSGFEVMEFRFSGQAAHAGAAPHRGVNAQNAASLFLQACAFLRETFHEEHHIRIHPILRLAEGQSVNIIPDSATVETYVRAADTQAISETVGKLRAAAEGCAGAIGARVEIEQIPGYAPFVADPGMHERLRSLVETTELVFIDEAYGAASSDMGDVSQNIPSIMLGLPGANGLFHNPAFRIVDEEAAFVIPSEIVARYLEVLSGS